MFDLTYPLLLLHAASTWYMLGLIWFVQAVHYPLLSEVGVERFVEYERRHVSRTGWVVAPPMLIELFTGVLLVWIHPAGVDSWLVATGLLLLAVVWGSTFLIQVPCHEALSRGFDEGAQRKLVRTNWLRTLAWSVRSGLVSWMLLA